ncbi:MAG TPA: SCO family protein [Candidatus Deferrimicrobium sp.]|nr:SCO family protein [Candidatus Deferrimicrobium sp.]
MARLIAGGVVMAALIAAAILITKQADESRSTLPVLGQVGPFEFVQQTGGTFGLSNLKGNIAVVDFIFTRCTGPCPVMSAAMAELYTAFEGSNKVQFISITVDPEYDSVDVLNRYAQSFGVVDDRWVFLRGPMEEIKRISENDFMLAADDLPAGHSTRFVLVDENGQIRGYYSGVDNASVNVLKSHIRELVKKLS